MGGRGIHPRHPRIKTTLREHFRGMIYHGESLCLQGLAKRDIALDGFFPARRIRTAVKIKVIDTLQLGGL